MRPEDESYFASLESGLEDAFDVAEAAKQRGEDPEPEVEIPVAKDMADRVENILGIDGVAERVRELEGEMSREGAALELVEDFVEERVGDYETKAGKVEGAVRTAVALLTEGVVAAPIEGIDRVEVNANDDGSEYVAVYYAGPIRSAGGTAQALSVLVADYARSLLDIDEFAPRDVEIERYAEEIALYDSETGLQYSPKDKETKFITEHCPVMLDGEATGNEEVDGFRDLERIETNSPRGGMCLVLAEGIALKAPKIQRYTRNLDEVEWPWLQDLIDGTIGEDDGDDADDGDEAAEASDDAASDAEAGDDEPEGPPRVDSSEKFLRDLIAGRPVFGHPSKEGGFRLRYGRARNHGNATAGVHPATMHLLDDFLATGTQIKTELPGKAAGVVPVDTIEGPTVKLANGDVRHIEDPAEALEVRNGVEEILDVGEYLVNYGEFVENNHELAPASYAPEWWAQDFEAAGADVQALRDSPYVDLEHPDAEQAIEWATEYDAPLHPAYTYLWHDLDVEHFETLADAVADADTDGDDLVLDRTEAVRESLEALLVTHHQDDEVLRVDDWLPLARSLGIAESLDREWDDLSADAREWPNALRAVNEVAPFEVQERAPTRIGNRMGRPEKSESRDLSPAVHTLFPIGEAGGSQRDVGDAARYAPDMADTPGEIPVRLGDRVCPDCGEHTYDARCSDCGEWTDPYYECDDCGAEAEPDESGRVQCPRCERDLDNVTTQVVDVGDEYRSALQAVGERENAFDQLKGVQGLMSAEKVPEPMEKGVLRAKHDVTAFKDGTVRYDMTDLPVTAVKPSELDVTVDHFRELGYTEDVHGDPLEHDDQVVELRVQDVVLSDGAAEHMLQTADFVDDLLTQYYGLDAFYELEERDDLVGELVFGMAPHTSAAVVGRVIGFTSASVGYAHPYFHAAKRRNCFHPETKVWFEDEGGEWHHDHIETLVEGRLDPATADEDDFGTLVQELDGDVFVPSVTEEGEETLQRVDAVSKHPAPDHLVEIETKSGRELTVTPDHSMRRWTGDGIERVEARGLTASDAVPAPKQIPVEGETVTFDLLAEFLDADAIPNDDLMVRGIGESGLKELLDDATDADSYLNPVAEHLEVSQSTVYNWVSRDSVSAGVLLELFDRETVVERVPDDVTLGVRRDTASVTRQFEVDETVGTMLGYYAAEGFTRRESGAFYQTTICTPDDVPRDEIIDVFDDVLNVEAFEENEWKVTVSSRLVAALFSDVLDAGSRAETKRVPDCVFSAPDSVLRAFLAAYFSGDGSASSDRVEVRAHTVSDDLRSDLVAALKRFGIATKVYREERTPETGLVAEFYDESRSFETWVLKVTSQNAVRFADRVGFHLDRKSETLSRALDQIDTRSQRLFGDGGDVWVDEVVSVKTVQSAVSHTYSLTVEETNTLVANDLFTGQCDGDEDCVMLLMDGLINFSKSFLPDKRGGSVAEDSRLVAVDPDGDVRFLTFEEFWNELESPIEVDGKFRKRTCYAEGWQTYAFDERHEASLKPIEKAIRYRADDDEQLVRVETQYGRSLEITEHHSLFRYDDGIEEVAGAELEAGDLVVAPRDLDVETRETTLDVAECVDDPYVVIDDDVEERLRTAWESTDRGSETHGAFNAGLAYRLRKSKIGFERFQRILSHSDVDVPTDVAIGLEGSTLGVTRTIEVDEEFAWFLGLFVAEGTTSGVNPCIHNADKDLIDRAADIAADKLGAEPERRWSNRSYELRFPAVFREVLYSLGFENADSYDSSEKVVPECIRHAPRSVVLDFLRGFLAGDGSDSSDVNVTTVGFHTTSDDVKDGIVFLLHRLGLVANVSTKTNRDGNRQDIHTVTVSGGANDNPLHRILGGDDPYLPKSLVVSIPSALMDLREMDIEGVKQTIPKYLKRRDNISLAKLTEIVDALDEHHLPPEAEAALDELRPLVDGDLSYLRVKDIESVDYDGYLYDLQVGGDPVFTANWLYAHNSMDAPLVMSSRIDPAEIDDEAHNIDIDREYPREFYEATRELADPEDVEDLVTIAEATLGTDEEYMGFGHTHDTSNIHLGPPLSAYKTLGSMMDKMDAQLELSRKLRAVDETDVAERVIEYHFLPDLIGNLRAFSRQETRCLDCGEKYRRMPLTGDCRECGGRVNLTVHEGSVNKYMDTAIQVAEDYDCREYTKQRLEIMDRRLASIFENDKNKQSGIADFM
jgi:DNA polymerase II large subunit